MHVAQAQNTAEWDSFLSSQLFRPFLQSWTMGEVYRDTGQEPIRLEVRENGEIVAICQAILVPAKRGRHLAIPYGPILSGQRSAVSGQFILDSLLKELKKVAKEHRCSFICMSPFLPAEASAKAGWPPQGSLPSPLHLLAEHIWYLPLVQPDPWSLPQTSNEVTNQRNNPSTPLRASAITNQPFGSAQGKRNNASAIPVTEEQLLMNMRKTTRNLIRRAEKDGVEIIASSDPTKDVEAFIALHEETRKRHHFTPYTNTFFRAQVTRFAERGECTVYLARYQGEIAAASIHIHMGGETSYHHGASASKFAKVPASYLLQWTVIRDALKRGDHVYNFWGIAPLSPTPPPSPDPSATLRAGGGGVPPLSPLGGKGPGDRGRHPFAGVTLFKTGFGGSLLPLVHCMDFPLSWTYTFTRIFEQLRKWRRGF